MIDFVERPGEELKSPAEKIGNLLAETLKNNPYFYFFSPDETTSNRFTTVFDVEKRAWGDLPIKSWDLPEAPDGRIVEMLSENVLFSVMTGHLSTGEQAMMGSYEAFSRSSRRNFFSKSNSSNKPNLYLGVNQCQPSTYYPPLLVGDKIITGSLINHLR